MKINKKILYLLAVNLIVNNEIAAAYDIVDSETINTSDIQDSPSIVFTGANFGGTLNYNNTNSRIFSSITSSHNSSGKLIVGSDGEGLKITNNIGTSNQNINYIQMPSANLYIGGNLYVANGVTGPNGSIYFNGDGSSVIDAQLGENDAALSVISIIGEDGKAVTFYRDLFADHFEINANNSATIANSVRNAQLGEVVLNGGSNLNLQSDANATRVGSIGSAITIAAGKNLTVTEDLSFGEGNLNLGINNSSSASPIISVVTGVSIADNSNINFDYSNATSLKKGDSFNFISVIGAEDTLTVDLDQIHVTGNSILLSPTIARSADNNSLVVTQNLNNSSINKLNKADQATTNFIVNDNSAAMNNARTNLFKISSQSGLQNALTTTQIDRSNMLQKTSMDMASAIERIADNRLQNLNYQQFLNSDKKQNQKTNNIWGQVFGGRSSQNSLADNSNSNYGNQIAGYDANFSGVVFGSDTTIKNNDTNVNNILGGTLSYSKANAKSNSPSGTNANINFYQLSLYNQNISTSRIGFFNENMLNIGYNQYSTDHNIIFDSYNSASKANFSALQYGGKVGFGYNFKVDNALVAPVASIKYLALQNQNYSEKNSDNLGLKVKNDSFNLATSDIGVRMIGSVGQTVQPSFNISWLHNLNSSKSKSTTYFLSDSAQSTSQTITSANLDKDALDIGTQLSFKTSQDSSFLLRYDLQKSRNFVGHIGSIRFGLVF